MIAVRSSVAVALSFAFAACGGAGSEPEVDAGVDAPPDGMVEPPPPPPPGLKAFDPDVLHVIEITVAAADLPALDDNNNVNRVPATMTFDGQMLTRVGLRKKGSTSRRPSSQKAGYTVKFNEFVPGQKVDGLEKLTIDNAIQDPSFLTGHLSYEVYRRAGLPAPRTAHAVMRFNGVDKGIFVIEESTDKAYLKRTFGNGTGNLYEGPWDFHKDVALADLKDIEEGRTRDDLAALKQVVMTAPDNLLEVQLAPLIDMEQFIKNYAVETAAALWDNYAYVGWNYYFYHVPGGRFVILTHGVNWPCCNPSGPVNWKSDLDPLNIFSDPWQTGNLDAFPPGKLCDRVNRVPALNAKFRAELARVSREAFDVTALIARADRVATMLHSKPLTGASAADRASFDTQIVNVRRFVRDRKAYLTTRLSL